MSFYDLISDLENISAVIAIKNNLKCFSLGFLRLQSKKVLFYI